jgi:hypothetical protein
LISTNEPLVVVHRRQQNDSWVTHLYRAGDQIAFTSLGLNLFIEVLYENVTLPANRPNGPSAERF